MLVVAGLWDLGKRRIPNWLNTLVAVTGLLAQAVERGWLSVLSGVGAGVIVIALLWKPWMAGRIGGGDVKLAGATALWTGVPLLPHYLLLTALAGGIVGIICYLWSSVSVRKEIRTNLTVAVGGLWVPEAPIRGGGGRTSVPYGVAVSAGALVVLWTQGG